MTGFSDAAGKWNQRYASADGLLFGREPNGWLASQADTFPADATVLCVADGEGRNSTWLASRGHRVTAFDISPVAIDRLAELAAERSVDVRASVSSVSDWTWTDAQYDAIVAVFIQFADPALRSWLFRQMAQAIRPGGLLIIEGYGPRQMTYKTGGPGIADHLYTLPLLCDAFEGWQFLAARDLDCEIVEGTAHAGLSHLVSATIRKPMATQTGAGTL